MSILMQPTHIGRLELKNRIVMAPMGVTIGNMTESTVAYFLERARAGRHGHLQRYGVRQL
jgi:2,4-dienoyl-CoA reductase-like NADH-dependent reductase (Old Yellow Enzyme family)